MDVETSRYGPKLSALVGLLGSAFPLSFSKTQALLSRVNPLARQPTSLSADTLLQQLVGVEMSCGAIATIRQRLSAALAQPMGEVLQTARQQPVA